MKIKTYCLSIIVILGCHDSCNGFNMGSLFEQVSNLANSDTVKNLVNKDNINKVLNNSTVKDIINNNKTVQSILDNGTVQDLANTAGVSLEQFKQSQNTSQILQNQSQPQIIQNTGQQRDIQNTILQQSNQALNTPNSIIANTDTQGSVASNNNSTIVQNSLLPNTLLNDVMAVYNAFPADKASFDNIHTIIGKSLSSHFIDIKSISQFKDQEFKYFLALLKMRLSLVRNNATVTVACQCSCFSDNQLIELRNFIQQNKCIQIIIS